MSRTATTTKSFRYIAYALAGLLCSAEISSAAKLTSAPDSDAKGPGPVEEQLLPAVVHSVRGYLAEGQAVIEWQTGSAAASIGFQLHVVEASGASRPIHEGWIAPPWSAPAGSTYRAVDDTAGAGRPRTYMIVERDEDAHFNMHGPYDLEFAAQAQEQPLAGAVEAFARHRSPAAGGDGSSASEQHGGVIPGETPKTVAKAFVRETGYHRITSADLAEALGQTQSKIETFLSRELIAVENQGQSVAWSSNAEETELRFFASAIDSRYTHDNVYWVTLGKPATLIASASAAATIAQPGGYFQSSAQSEEDLIPAINSTKFEDVDFWYWDGIRAEDPAENRKSFPLASPDVVVTGGQAELTVSLAGATKGTGYRYHRAVIYVNGVEVGNITWLGLYWIEHTVTFDASLLAESNVVEIEGTLVSGAIGSAFFVDAFDLTYPRYYEAGAGALLLTADSNSVVTVDGLSEAEAIVLNLANPNEPVLCDGVLVEPQAGDYRASFTPNDPSTRHLVTTPSALLSVHTLQADTFYSDPWQDTSGHDYIVIVPEALREPADRLMEHRRSQGLDPYILVVEDLYDYFTGGVADAFAVRDFLAWADVNWTLKPRYVFLVGKGTFDPKDNEGFGDNLITPAMVATPYGMAASDNLLADIDEDRIPDFAIGRLPALTAEEFAAYVEKVIAFEEGSGAWLNEALMLADNPDQSGDFTTLSNQAIGHLPAGMTASTVYLEEQDITTARANLFADWSQGKRIVNYIGHGGVDVFASESLLHGVDTPALSGIGTSAVVSALSCVVGMFELPGWDSLSESLLGAVDGGAITMWAPTSPSYSGAAQELNHDYFDALGQPGARVGDSVLTAIQANAPGSASFLLETYTLLGDPATKIN